MCQIIIIINNTINLFFNCNQHFGNFKPQQFPADISYSVALLFDKMAQRTISYNTIRDATLTCCRKLT